MPAPLEDDRDRDGDRDGPPAVMARWDDLDLENGEVVIYDVHNHHAWIQSDQSYDLTPPD